MRKVNFTRRYTTDVSYEYEEYTVSTEVEDGDDIRSVMAALKADVEAAHLGESSSTDDAGTDEEELPEEESDKKPSKKSKRSRTTTRGKESEEAEDGTDPEEETEETDDDTGSETETEDDAGEEAEEEAPPKKSAKKSGSTGSSKADASPPKKAFKKKPQVYQRANETHKDLFGTVLRKVAPNWKKSFESKAHAKKVSKNLEGVEFLDENGKVLASFEADVKKQMGKFK